MAILPDHLIVKFQELAKEEYGIEITKTQALQEGLRLAGLVQVGNGLKLTTTKYENYDENKHKIQTVR
jgi:hypothetical protein